MHKYMGTQNWRSAGALSLYGRGVADPQKYDPPHLCYPAEFDRSRSNGTSVIKEIRLKI